MILILTNKEDAHADEVIQRLSIRNIPVFRLNTEDLLHVYSVNFSIDRSGRWRGEIADSIGRTLCIESLKVAWFRKPDYDFHGRVAVTPDEHFVVAETKALVNALYSIPIIRWINDPFIANRSKVKFQQLLLAGQLGVKTPRTIITSCPEIAERFFITCNEDVLVKSIYTASVQIGDVHQTVPSKRIGREEFYKFYTTIAYCPTQLQEYVEKDFELRITVIGDKVFAVRIDSQLHEETKVDWRIYTELNPHSVFTLPARIEQFCIDFLREQQLLYGAMDFIVTPEGEYFFLENNPFGQYLWLEEMTSIPITEALVDLLVSLS